MEESKTVNIAHHANDPNVGLPMTDKLETFKMYVGDTGLFVSLAFAVKDVTENIIYQKRITSKNMCLRSYKAHKSLDLFCEKYSDRISNRYLMYTKDFGKDEQILMVPVYMASML